MYYIIYYIVAFVKIKKKNMYEYNIFLIYYRKCVVGKFKYFYTSYSSRVNNSISKSLMKYILYILNKKVNIMVVYILFRFTQIQNHKAIRKIIINIIKKLKLLLNNCVGMKKKT